MTIITLDVDLVRRSYFTSTMLPFSSQPASLLPSLFQQKKKRKKKERWSKDLGNIAFGGDYRYIILYGLDMMYIGGG